jgi:hypothetical protein
MFQKSGSGVITLVTSTQTCAGILHTIDFGPLLDLNSSHQQPAVGLFFQ